MQMNSFGDMMPSFFHFTFVNCLHFVCKVRQGTSPKSFEGCTASYLPDLVYFLQDIMPFVSALSYRHSDIPLCLLLSAIFFIIFFPFLTHQCRGLIIHNNMPHCALSMYEINSQSFTVRSSVKMVEN